MPSLRFVLPILAAAPLLTGMPAQAQPVRDPDATSPSPTSTAPAPPVATPPASAPVPGRAGLYLNLALGPAFVDVTTNVEGTLRPSQNTGQFGDGSYENVAKTIGAAISVLVGTAVSKRWVVGGGLHLQRGFATLRATDAGDATSLNALVGGFASYHFADEAGPYVQALAGLAYSSTDTASFDKNDAFGLGVGLGAGIDVPLAGAWKLGPAARLTYLTPRRTSSKVSSTSSRTSSASRCSSPRRSTDYAVWRRCAR